MINLPEDIDIQLIDGYEPMTEEASDVVYHRIGEFQEANLSKHKFQHSETGYFSPGDGSEVILRLRETNQSDEKPELPSSKIKGVIFKPLPSITTGAERFIVPLTRKSPLYIVEHGNRTYDFIHLGQEDHLTFLCEGNHSITLKLVDMRSGSATPFLKEQITFIPKVNMELVIPCGVAHALFNMAEVKTVNRPVIYLDPDKEYIPGHDVIDWPVSNRHYLPC